MALSQAESLGSPQEGQKPDNHAIDIPSPSTSQHDEGHSVTTDPPKMPDNIGTTLPSVLQFVRSVDALIWRTNRAEDVIFCESNISALMDRLELWERAVRTRTQIS